MTKREQRLMDLEEREWLIKQANKEGSDYMDNYWPQLEDILDKNNITLEDDE